MMKNIISVLIIFLMISCSGDSAERNPYLPETSFSFDINTNLPLYGSLSNPGSAIYVGNAGVGIKGIFVYNAGFGNFFAWEASCPNHTPSNCSTMSIINGNMCECSCENYQYSLVNGTILSETNTEKKPHALLNYRVNVNGNVVTVYN